jgi:2-oxoglutarate dehydrogenase E1 component
MTSQNSPERLNRASNAIFEETAFLFGGNAAFVESLYAQYLDDPSSVDPSWARYFSGLEGPKGPSSPSWAHRAQTAGAVSAAPVGGAATAEDLRLAAMHSIRAIQLIRAYRVIGHFAADLDPLKLAPKPDVPQLDPRYYGFKESDLDTPVFIDGVLGLQSATPREMVDLLQHTYSGRIGYEFQHIHDAEQKDWLQRRIEGSDNDVSFTPAGKRAIFNKLIEAEGFEKFCALRFLGTKRFGLDGGEAMIPALEQIIKRGGQLGVKDVVIGMAHRGRLNVLANVLSKPYRQIFHEFRGGSSNPIGLEVTGDVKYHLGASSNREFDGNHIHLSLTPNPSHLEASDPVVLGKARAKQTRNNDTVARSSVLPMLLHGDAAFAGQGIVAECFAMSGIKGYRTGGTIHFVINNQIGFTTSPQYSRSSAYCTDIALMVQAPIFHVNGDDPEAVVHAARIATEFRQLFHKDVVIDMYCYRRFGHNETDEPSFTQPIMYRAIKDHPTTLELYAKKLVAESTLAESEVAHMIGDFNQRLDDEFEASKTHVPDRADWLSSHWLGFEQAPKAYKRGETGVEKSVLLDVGKTLSTIPQGFNAHKTIARQMQNKARMFETGEGIDWATAEALAFGTLVNEGTPVRLSGQDCGRGTFSQRHSVLVDQDSEERYIPLANVSEKQAEYEVIDSLLSENAVLGFEYGYSTAEPRALVLWEAQFGDFANGAQVLIDQFIASGEMKWLRMSGLVMLLPHGYEGQGPEHSSARLERYLQLSAQDNWQVCNPTTPANYFHVLRRQIVRPFRKPLILMTPKSLLRHKRCVSFLSDLQPGTTFHRVFRDQAECVPGATTVQLAPDNEIKRVILCSGKVYFDLMEAREKVNEPHIQMLRLEQLYPFPEGPLGQELERFPNAEIVWVQEEPRNQGAWSYVRHRIEYLMEKLGRRVRPRYIGRPDYASTAAGLMSQHTAELQYIMDESMRFDLKIRIEDEQ